MQFVVLKIVMAYKWMENRSFVFACTALEGMSDVSSVQKWENGFATKSALPYPTVVKIYNNIMGGVDLMDQRTAAYWLDCKSSVQLYLRIFFDLLDTACANSFLVYNIKHPKQLPLLDYKIIIAKNLIWRHQSC